jgi:hypothetical protein
MGGFLVARRASIPDTRSFRAGTIQTTQISKSRSAVAGRVRKPSHFSFFTLVCNIAGSFNIYVLMHMSHYFHLVWAG